MSVSIIKPFALQSGEVVQIVAPASNLKTEYLARGVAELTHLGFRVNYDPTILELDRYTAGSDERRAHELMSAFTNPEVKAVWAARGGYGVMRLFSLLDEDLLRANPKIFIGYSDLTALQLYLYRRFGWVTFHGAMAAKDLAGGETHYDQKTLLQALTSTAPMGEIEAPETEMLHRGKTVSGRLLGGCLTLVTALMGTPDELDTTDSILFLEDTGVRPYQLDRMIQQLKLAGKFDRVRAIIFGEMNNCIQNTEQGYTLQEVLRDLTADLHIPVMFGLRSGHSNTGNLTLPLGVMASLDGMRGVLSIDEAAVK
jgi:muramoyltetrapeptide carboxypeptidase